MMYGGMERFTGYRRRAARLAALLCIVAALAGCGGRETRVASGTRDGVLHVGNGAEPEGLDPHLVTGVPEHRVLSALFEGLVNLDPETLDPVPGAAERWSMSDDGLVYTFELRREARWSDGSPVTAGDFLYAWRRILEPSLASKYATMLHCIQNARAYNEGALTDFEAVGVRAIDDHRLEVTLEQPTPYFLSLHIHYTWFPVQRAAVERHGAMTSRDGRWTRPGNLVGNGPFRLERWDPDRLLTVVKNEHYWDADNVRLKEIRFYPVKDLLTEDRMFRTGELHLTENVPLSRVEVYQREGWDALQIKPYLGVYYFRVNVTRPPFDDARVRRAFSMAVDRTALVERVVKAGRQPAAHYVPPDTGGYTGTAAVAFDVEGARRLLAEAGYPEGRGLPPIELLYNTSENHKQIAEALQQMWRQHLGAEVSLLNQDWKVYLTSMDNLDYSLARSGWIADYNDPYNFLECFLTGNGNNRTGYSSAEYDALLREAEGTLDPRTRYALLDRAETLLLEDAPIVPIYFYTRVYLKSPDIRGYRANNLGYIAWKHLYLEPGAHQGVHD